jgi:hypothetical protein
MSRLPTTPIGLLTLALSAFALPAAAQEMGGVPLSREALAAGGPSGLAQPLPFVLPSITAADVQRSIKAVPPALPPLGATSAGGVDPATGLVAFDGGASSNRRRQHITINNFDGPVAFIDGSGNVVQQQQASSANGPVALQQVGGAPGGSGGAVNVVGANGNIVQRSARSSR